ncbi:hypothetical protein JW887_07095 [Candidatus Dojkabacteria bacterium]|nr:hypothetical protein [Candidatus Dojkabacteria bacterium]
MIIKFNTNRRNKYEYFDVEEVVEIIRHGNYKCTFYSKEFNFNKTRYREDHLFNLKLKGFIRNLRRLKDENSFKNYDLFFNTNFRIVGIDNSKIKEGINDSYIKRVFKEKNPIDFASDLKNCLPAVLWGISSFGNEPHPRWKSKPNTLNNNIKKINQYIVIDIDHLPKQHIEDIKSRLFQEFEFVVMAFVSPSGDGLKFVCEFDDMNGLFSDIKEVPYSTLRKMWDSLNNQILAVLNDNIYGIVISRDESADDVNRLCYLSYDPEIWIYPKKLDGKLSYNKSSKLP